MNPLGQFYLRSNSGTHAQILCNDDYSALVVPQGSGQPDSSSSLFTLYALGSSAQVALGINCCGTGENYVSNRFGDWYGKLQVQAPGSADWITAVGGDEIYMLFPLPPDGAGQKGIALWSSMYNAFVSVRYDEADDRADNGYPVRTRMGGLFGSDPGTPVTNAAAWETLQLVQANGASGAPVVLQLAVTNPNINRFPGYNDYTACDFTSFSFASMDLTNYLFVNGKLDYADFSEAVSIEGMNITGASTVGTNFGNHDVSRVLGYSKSA